MPGDVSQWSHSAVAGGTQLARVVDEYPQLQMPCGVPQRPQATVASKRPLTGFVDKYPQVGSARPEEARSLSPLPRQAVQAGFVDKYPHGDRMRARSPEGQWKAVCLLLVVHARERMQQEEMAVPGARRCRWNEETGVGVADRPLLFDQEGGGQEVSSDEDEGLRSLRRQRAVVDKYPQVGPIVAAPPRTVAAGI